MLVGVWHDEPIEAYSLQFSAELCKASSRFFAPTSTVICRGQLLIERDKLIA